MALLGGQFKSATHGQFESAQGGQFDRNLQSAKKIIGISSFGYRGKFESGISNKNPFVE